MASIADHSAEPHDDERIDRSVTTAILAGIAVLMIVGLLPNLLW